ncbi:MAG: homoserine dehydrogenase, partial [Verrucomicrobiaceae bacterium]|nr:homoserine dehydrogenase [Verrucomicrobiaceae bacterium]
MPQAASPRPIRIGLAGLGNVGAGVYKNLQKNASLIEQRTGASLSVGKVVVRNIAKARDVEVPAELLTTDWRELISDPSLAIIVELIGGTGEAFELVSAALKAKKIVVTGNKA